MNIKNIKEIVGAPQYIVVQPGEKSSIIKRKGDFLVVIVTEGEGRIEHTHNKCGYNLTFDSASINRRIPRLTYMDGDNFVLIASPESRAPLTVVILQMMLTCKL